MSYGIAKTGFTGPEENTKREPIRESVKLDVIERQIEKRQGREVLLCSKCRNEIEEGSPVEFNHILPVYLGGKSTAQNLEALHPECHKEITKAQAGEFAKTRSIAGLTGKKGRAASLKERWKW